MTTKSALYTPEEDKIIVRMVRKRRKYADIAQELGNGRSEHGVRHRVKILRDAGSFAPKVPPVAAPELLGPMKAWQIWELAMSHPAEGNLQVVGGRA